MTAGLIVAPASFDVVGVFRVFDIKEGKVSVDCVRDIHTIAPYTMSSGVIQRPVDVERVVCTHEQGAIPAEVFYKAPHAGTIVALVEEDTPWKEVEL